jgi:hypothetical protein
MRWIDVESWLIEENGLRIGMFEVKVSMIARGSETCDRVQRNGRLGRIKANQIIEALLLNWKLSKSLRLEVSNIDVELWKERQDFWGLSPRS